MSEFDPQSYTITVKRVFEDGEPMFKATVKELPHVAEYGNSYNEVYELAIDTIVGLREMAGDMGHPFPDPIEDDDNFSGRVTLRMPKSLHRSTAHMADIEGVSLNQYLVSTIAEKIGGVQMYKVAAESLTRQIPISGVTGSSRLNQCVVMSGAGTIKTAKLAIGRAKTVSSEGSTRGPMIYRGLDGAFLIRERQGDG